MAYPLPNTPEWWKQPPMLRVGVTFTEAQKKLIRSWPRAYPKTNMQKKLWRAFRVRMVVSR